LLSLTKKQAIFRISGHFADRNLIYSRTCIKDASRQQAGKSLTQNHAIALNGFSESGSEKQKIISTVYHFKILKI